MLKVVASCATLPCTGNLLGVMPSDDTSHGCTSRHHQLCNQTSCYLGMLQDTWLHDKDAILIPKVVASCATLLGIICTVCFHKQLLASSFPGPFEQAWEQGYTSCATGHRVTLVCYMTPGCTTRMPVIFPVSLMITLCITNRSFTAVLQSLYEILGMETKPLFLSVELQLPQESN